MNFTTGIRYGSARLGSRAPVRPVPPVPIQDEDEEEEVTPPRPPLSPIYVQIADNTAEALARHRPRPDLRRSSTVMTADLVARVAASTGFSVPAVAHVYGLVIALISAQLHQKEQVKIERFGTFLYVRTTTGTGHLNPGRPTVRWLPDATMRARIANSSMSKSTPPPKPPSLPPIRAIDRALITRWIDTRCSHTRQTPTQGTSDADVFSDGTGNSARRPWMDVGAIHSAVTMLSRWMPCPLHEVGFENVEGTLEYRGPLARRQVLEAVAGLTTRFLHTLNPRVRDHATRVYPNDNPALHSITWARITRYAPQFYDWLEFCGVRPRGTNPLLHLRRSTAASVPRKYWVQLAAVDPILRAAETATPRTRAVVYLLANGLRRREVAGLKVEDVRLDLGEVRVYGKGSARGQSGARLRMVPLLPWTRKALDAWLVARATTTLSPWLFPQASDPELHIRKDHITVILRQHVVATFPRAIDRPTGLSPHAFRLWFVTRSYHNRVPTDQIMAATGHASLASMETYLVTHPDQTKAAYAAATTRSWFAEPNANGAAS